MYKQIIDLKRNRSQFTSFRTRVDSSRERPKALMEEGIEQECFATFKYPDYLCL
ncbi:hypothetical protein L4D09_27555 [Photobacterium makurazakiensis]|uniref:hypothetical protein n=1 Tax=Photobacterium makurazakiensis TaxID=2910234 RepID=UPI003D0D91E3